MKWKLVAFICQIYHIELWHSLILYGWARLLLSAWLAQLVNAPPQVHVQSCSLEVQLHSHAGSLTRASILLRSLKWVPASAGGWSPCAAMGWRVMCRAASGTISFKNCIRHSARGLSIVKRSCSNCVTMTPLYKSLWFNFNLFQTNLHARVGCITCFKHMTLSVLCSSLLYRCVHIGALTWRALKCAFVCCIFNLMDHGNYAVSMQLFSRL